MNLQALGHTRTVVRSNYALLTPDTFVRAPLPGMENATAIVHASPAMGAGFTQYTAELQSSGRLGHSPMQRFFYVLEGVAVVRIARKQMRVGAGGFAYIPPGVDHEITSRRKTRLSVIEKPYTSLEGAPPPVLSFGMESSIEPQPLMGDAKVQVRSLVPASSSYDLAVNTMTYAPGATLPMVETHVMEHGLLMISGDGIYRLGADWHPVTEGDFIWMGPYCPQWFGALGEKPARYLIYKDWNRHPHC